MLLLLATCSVGPTLHQDATCSAEIVVVVGSTPLNAQVVAVALGVGVGVSLGLGVAAEALAGVAVIVLSSFDGHRAIVEIATRAAAAPAYQRVRLLAGFDSVGSSSSTEPRCGVVTGADTASTGAAAAGAAVAATAAAAAAPVDDGRKGSQ